MSSAQQPNLDSSKPSEPTADDKKLPQLGALEEDDEFEEFAEQEWNPSESSLAHLTSANDASSETAPTTTSNLWEDNWDDDDVDEEFSKQLRAELEKQSNGPQAMST